MLETQQADGSLRVVNQSVHGNDYWQTDYDSVTGTWEITYTLAADCPGDARQARAFRFRLEN
jgi:hypothetical protein